MPRPMSRAHRRTAFLDAAAEFFDEFETWYDQHPHASFEHLEAHARPSRRAFMGTTFALLINGRDCGMQLDPPICPQPSATGASRALVILAEIGLIRFVVCPHIFEEVERNLQAKAPRAAAFFHDLRATIPGRQSQIHLQSRFWLTLA